MLGRLNDRRGEYAAAITALEDAAKAHARMETSEHIGKIVLKV